MRLPHDRCASHPLSLKPLCTSLALFPPRAYLSHMYPKGRLTLPLGIMMGMVVVSQAISPLLGAGLLAMNGLGGLAGWQVRALPAGRPATPPAFRCGHPPPTAAAHVPPSFCSLSCVSPLAKFSRSAGALTVWLLTFPSAVAVPH